MCLAVHAVVPGKWRPTRGLSEKLRRFATENARELVAIRRRSAIRQERRRRSTGRARERSNDIDPLALAQDDLATTTTPIASLVLPLATSDAHMEPAMGQGSGAKEQLALTDALADVRDSGAEGAKVESRPARVEYPTGVPASALEPCPQSPCPTPSTPSRIARLCWRLCGAADLT